MTEEEADVIVRPAEPGDAEAIDRLLLYLDAFHAAARPDMFRTPAGKPRGEDFLAGLLADAEQTILVALRAGELAGYVLVRVRKTPAEPYRVERRFGEIEHLAVLPEAQGLGLGGKLLQAALDWLVAQGVDDHQIAVHAFNQPALRLYERFGFTPSVISLRRKA